MSIIINFYWRTGRFGHLQIYKNFLYKTKAEISKEIKINPVLNKIRNTEKNDCNI
jgi:hypothetical protein